MPVPSKFIVRILSVANSNAKLTMILGGYMTALVAVHPKISSLVKDSLIKTGYDPVSIQSSLAPAKNVNTLFRLLAEKAFKLLILDTLLLPKRNCLDTLRRLRLSHPGLSILLLSPQPQRLEQLRTELAVLQIYDMLSYRTNSTGLVQLQEALPQLLLHPIDILSYLQKTAFGNSEKPQASPTKTFIAVAGLEEGSGTTKTALLLSLYIKEKVLLVELNPERPVLQEFFLLDEYYDASNNLYYLPGHPNLAIVPYMLSRDWIKKLELFQHIILDLGVLPKNPCDSRYAEFMRCNRSIVTSYSSPWNIQYLQQLELPRSDSSLWLTFCPKEHLRIIQRSLERNFSTIVSAPYQPDWLSVSVEQAAVCKDFLSR
jgi:hypothetical protein